MRTYQVYLVSGETVGLIADRVCMRDGTGEKESDELILTEETLSISFHRGQTMLDEPVATFFAEDVRGVVMNKNAHAPPALKEVT